jgi:hypothetical protein
MKTNVNLWYLPYILFLWEIGLWRKNFAEKLKVNWMKYFFPKIVPFLLTLKYARVRQATHNNVTLVGKCVIFIPDNKSKIRHTHTFYLTIFTWLHIQWLHGRALMLRYKYISCLVDFIPHVINREWSKSLCAPDDFLPHYLFQSDRFAADRQGQGDTELTPTPSVIPNSHYVIMVSDWNCLKYFCVFLYWWIENFWSPGITQRGRNTDMLSHYILFISEFWEDESVSWNWI